MGSACSAVRAGRGCCGLGSSAARPTAITRPTNKQNTTETHSRPTEERKFTPHVTLARLKDAPADRIGRFLSDRGLFRAGPMPVDHVTLYRSHLGNGGAVYEALREYPLTES